MRGEIGIITESCSMVMEKVRFVTYGEKYIRDTNIMNGGQIEYTNLEERRYDLP